MFTVEQLQRSIEAEQNVNLAAPIWREYLELYGLSEVADACDPHFFTVADQDATNLVQHYRQRGTCLGTVIVCHGYMDHSGLYRHLVSFLLAQQWDVLIYDQRGHGGSSGERYAIDSFSQYAQELDKVLQHCRSALRGDWVLLGQSTGGAIVMEHRFAGAADYPIVQRILLAPLVRSAGFGKIALLHALLGKLISKVKRAPSRSSHDHRFTDFINLHDPLRHRYVKMSWIAAMLSWQRTFKRHLYPTDNLLVIQGDDDQTVDWRYNTAQIKKVFPAVEIHPVPGAKHHLVNEAPHWRNQVFDRVGGALERLLRRGSAE
ncbi:MAG: alpha/beta hydrolase [Pseudomonadales bacterium]